MSTPVSPSDSTGRVMRDRKGFVYEPAVGRRLKPLLALLFLSFAFLGATGAYTLSVELLNTIQERVHTTMMTLWVGLAHFWGGVLVIVPFVVFGVVHWRTARLRKNRRAIVLGKLLFYLGIIVCVSGLALAQLHEQIQLPTGSLGRNIVYWLHVVAPLAVVAVYVLHRRAGPDIQWRWGIGWAGSVAGFIAAMIALHSQDPRQWNKTASPEGDRYFQPSLARTSDGQFIPHDTLMMDEYCMKCHEDIYKDHLHSAHRNSSFSNPTYLFSVLETRKVGKERDGHTRASRWCAGCHDPVPFFSGQFDDPEFDDAEKLHKNPTAHAGITCTACHAMTHVNSAKGNGDYVIEEPLHYPFAKSDNPFLQYVNNQLVKAKPAFHKQTFLKPFHKTAEFCSTCHKVSLPVELNQYKEFLRGQNHYDTYLLSGVSGVGTRSFYYPPQAKSNCAECHMPLRESNDFGSKDFDGSGKRKVHNHLFPAANTGLPWLLSIEPKEPRGLQTRDGFRKAALAHADFLRGSDEGKDRKLRIDLFGIKEGGGIDGKLHVLRPVLPTLKPGGKYLVEVVIRTLNIGHFFTQGTTDSNEVWVEFEASQGGRTFARNGSTIDKPGITKGEQKLPDREHVVLDDRPVDRASHFVNVLMLDRDGNRINRRNPQDIFTPLYNHQIPPGAGQVVHYVVTVPANSTEPIRLKVRLRYRKFDFEYMALVEGGGKKVPQMPVVDLCEDVVEIGVEGGGRPPAQTSPIAPAWQRWYDYGIGCFIEGGLEDGLGSKNSELSQALEAFEKVAEIGAKATAKEDKPAHGLGLLGQARVGFRLYGDKGGRTTELINRAVKTDPPPPWWTVSWLSAKVNIENSRIDKAILELEKIVDEKYQPRERGFDFRRDYVVLNDLGNAYYEWAKLQLDDDDKDERDRWLRKAIATFEKVLAIDSEDQTAHFGLYQCYTRLGSLVPGRGDFPGVAETKALADVLADPGRSKEERVEAAAGLTVALQAMSAIKFKEATKTPICTDLVKKLGKVFRDDPDPAMKAAAASVLAAAHNELFKVLKPDDLAASKTQEKYRAAHPHADRAANAIILYPTDHRPE